MGLRLMALLAALPRSLDPFSLVAPVSNGFQPVCARLFPDCGTGFPTVAPVSRLWHRFSDCGTGFQPVGAPLFLDCGTGFQPVSKQYRPVAADR